VPKPRVILIGWDAADWKVIEPLARAGQMPSLARLMAGGVHGNIATIYPALSPMLWTSIATGKRAYKHGIHGFTEPLPDGSGIRPVTLFSRKTKALWNILNQTGHRSVVVGWWPSHPAEPLNGVMVSNHFGQPVGKPGDMPPLPAGTVHPASLAGELGELRVNPMELSGEFIRLFVPEYEKVDQTKDKRLHSLGKIIGETMSVHAAATELLANQEWDFAAIYYSGIDHFGHAFMRYHPPRLAWVTEEDFAVYQHVIANAYRYHDGMLGALLGLADENTTVILLSDHGFHPDHLRPSYIPAEPAGPAVEHRHFGILCLKGPALRANERLFGASLLDICPTILTLFGLPPGRDMDGKVLVTAFKEPPAIEPIESWDGVPGEDGTHPPEARLDPVASAQAFRQLVELGYVAPPGATVQETVEECLRELKYNLARAYRDANCCGDAARLAEGLWTRWPKEHRFGILLVECLGPLRQVERRRSAIEELGRRIELYKAEAEAELAEVRSAKCEVRSPALEVQSPKSKVQSLKSEARSPASGVEDQKVELDQSLVTSAPTMDEASPAKEKAADPEQRRREFEERHARELACGRPLLIEWLLVSQALLEKRHGEARRHLEKLQQADGLNPGANERVAGALAELGDLEAARSLLEAALQEDSENPLVHAQLAGIHFQAGRLEASIAAAAESLSLLYFQPGLHALLGQALMETNRPAEAEQELRVAVAQSPRHLAAHELLGRLYREHLGRPAEAFAHEGRARALRHELAVLRRNRPVAAEVSQPIIPEQRSAPTHAGGYFVNGPVSLRGRAACGSSTPARLPAPFVPGVDARRIITVVSGLPRSGTSMMMQLLVAAGREALTDARRAPDEDNPLGYFEFARTTELATDASWLPQARGKVVKIVAQLLPWLPSGEHYNLIFMERSLAEVIASQNAMLDRQGRSGAELDGPQLMETYRAQLHGVGERLARRADLRTLRVNYAELVADPEGGVDTLALFLGEPFIRQAAARSVRPELQRQKA
jgi:predicted AlkP superfamily phosphohydrolase/phosphomutase/tetratricopeptide (TPR) repeat protein